MDWTRIMSLIPLVLQGVALAETVLNNGSGEDKKKLATGVTVGLMGQFGLPVTQKSVDLVSLSIDSVVGVLNESGAFQKPKPKTDPKPKQRTDPKPKPKTKPSKE